MIELFDWLKANPFATAMLGVLLVVGIVVALDLLTRERGRGHQRDTHGSGWEE